jgi:hypothetical protein
LLQNRYEIFQAYRGGEHDLRLWPKACRAGAKVPIDISKIIPIISIIIRVEVELLIVK